MSSECEHFLVSFLCDSELNIIWERHQHFSFYASIGEILTCFSTKLWTKQVEQAQELLCLLKKLEL